VAALDLLQEQHVGVDQPQVLAHLVNNQPALEKRQTFVDVVGCDVQRVGHVGGGVISPEKKYAIMPGDARLRCATARATVLLYDFEHAL
jgi:hypothetical protein